MENQGWIKDYRKEMDSDIWVMPPLYLKVWQYLKYMANHKRNEIPMSDGSKETIERGEHLTSYRGVARGVGYYENGKYKEPNPKTIKKIIDWLEKNKMITINNGKGNRQYTKINIVNYKVYQSEESEEVTVKAQRGNSKVTPSTHESNSKVTAEKHFVDINKNEKNDIRMKENEEEGKEETFRTELLFPTPSCKSIYNAVGDSGYRSFFMNAEIKEDNETIRIKANSEIDKTLIAQYIPKFDWKVNKKVELI
ncbi:MAG: hypothetical protein ACRCVJ_00755 [Clostridium sp.]|uniref:hypothetical protein n=1 Tax=Clostridium sp. TaxID=1506 RepID=UPI003F404688